MITNWKLVTAGTAVTGLALGALVGFSTDDEAVEEIDLIRSTEGTLDDALRARTNLDRMVVSDSPAIDDVAPDVPVRHPRVPDSPASPADSPSRDSPEATGAPAPNQSSARTKAASPDSPEPARAPAPDSPDSPASPDS